MAWRSPRKSLRRICTILDRVLAKVLLVLGCFLYLGRVASQRGLALPVFPDDHDNIEPPNPGSLALSKTATPVEGTTNKWQVTPDSYRHRPAYNFRHSSCHRYLREYGWMEWTNGGCQERSHAICQ